MGKRNIVKTYRDHVRSLGRSASARQQAVGGDFDAIGAIEKALVVECGLRPGDYLIDVGCGSGRLAKPLSAFLTGRYLGTDIVPELLQHARSLVDRPDWQFELIDGLTIPEQDDAADMVCFFSVFTHLLHEQSFAYLREARRVVRPGGRIVFSYLEYTVPAHWAVFETALADLDGKQPLTVFLSRDAVDAWSKHLELPIVAIHPAGEPHIPLPEPVTRDDGTVIEGPANLGQSVCVLEKPAA